MKLLFKLKSHQRGFTLIELLVVIAIISLLSSVVFASLRDAREKAMISKTLQEMKSLQVAIELYRDKFGYYPNGDTAQFNSSIEDSDRTGANAIALGVGVGSLEDFIKEKLVDNGFISKVPHAPNYPNNCGSDCFENGYILGYSAHSVYLGGSLFSSIVSTDPYDGYACGGEKINNYVVYLFANNKTVNLPRLEIVFGGTPFPLASFNDLGKENVYCIAG